MSGKLRGIEAINTNPLSNRFCRNMHVQNTICKFCYSIEILRTYRSRCIPAWEKNSEQLGSKFVRIPNIKTDIVRFNAHGELINKLHLFNYLRITNYYPSKIFTLWTKRAGLVQKVFSNHKKPPNLILIYSNIFINKPTSPPKFFDKTFTVFSKRGDHINCGGRCRECMICYSHNNVKQIFEAVNLKGMKSKWEHYIKNI